MRRVGAVVVLGDEEVDWMRRGFILWGVPGGFIFVEVVVVFLWVGLSWFVFVVKCFEVVKLHVVGV